MPEGTLSIQTRSARALWMLEEAGVDYDLELVEKDEDLAGLRVAGLGLVLEVELGESVEVVLPPAKAFGEHDPNLTFSDDINNVPPQFRRVGAEVQMQNDRGETRSFFVSKIEDDRLTVDGNHPLAGKALNFDLELVSID